MLRLHAENVFTIGVVNATKQPVAVAPNLRNLPDKGIYAYEPGAFFGIYHPDTFWIEGADKKSAVRASDANTNKSLFTRATGAPTKP
ncbi:MAG: hypothetical protein AAFO62_08820 [Pseudomonadota bacterium]